MARRPRLALDDVRSLSVREIVHRWRQEAEFHPKTLERELRRFLDNERLDWQAGERIDPNTPDADLQPVDTLVDRDWLELFCRKKGWDKPRFWFPPDPEQVRPQGRPSKRRAIVQEFEERAARGETLGRISDEARAIYDALTERGAQDLPEPKTIQGHIRDRFNEIKAES